MDGLETRRGRLAAIRGHFRKHGWKQIAWDYVQISAGALLLAAGYNIFFVPNNVVSGGISGVGIIIHHLLGLPVGVVTFALNLPLFVAMLRWSGGVTTGIRTIYAVLVMSAAIDLTANLVPHIADRPLLYVTYGGLLDGLGVGLVLRAQATTAGTDIIARLLRRFTGLEISRGVFVSNALIVALAALVFGLERAMYGVMVAAVSALATDTVLSGGRRARQALIISERWEEVRDGLLRDLERGVTILQGQGAYTGQDRPVLLCVIAPREVAWLRRLVMEIDPQAFVIIGSAPEVYGEGFAQISREP
jgi:uncharacterized membrane-anchored protein YitT (DUF2179 family)